MLYAIGDDRLINAGVWQRHHDRTGISNFNAETRSLPYLFDLIERHPEGSQVFVRMTAHPFLAIVAKDPESSWPL